MEPRVSEAQVITAFVPLSECLVIQPISVPPRKVAQLRQCTSSATSKRRRDIAEEVIAKVQGSEVAESTGFRSLCNF